MAAPCVARRAARSRARSPEGRSRRAVPAVRGSERRSMCRRRHGLRLLRTSAGPQSRRESVEAAVRNEGAAGPTTDRRGEGLRRKGSRRSAGAPPIAWRPSRAPTVPISHQASSPFRMKPHPAHHREPPKRVRGRCDTPPECAATLRLRRPSCRESDRPMLDRRGSCPHCHVRDRASAAIIRAVKSWPVCWRAATA